jgi:hypothetical protein
MTRIPGRLQTITLLPAFFGIVGMALLWQWLDAVHHNPSGEEAIKEVSEITHYGLVAVGIVSLAISIRLCQKGIPRKGSNRFLIIGTITIWWFAFLCLILYLG